MKAFLQGRWLGHPLHTLLVHFPIGLWVLSLLLDLIGFFIEPTCTNALECKNPFVAASFMCLAGGTVMALIAAIPGLADWSDIREDVLYALFIWWLDRHEKEPMPLLIVAFVWGAAPAIIIAIILSLAAGQPLQNLVTSEGMLRIAEVGLVAPVVEEAVKAVVLVFLFLAFRREFDNVLDGIVYGALVGLGFSFVENVLYLVGEGTRTGTEGMVQLWLLRAGVFGLNHSMWTAFTGAALGFARSLPGGITRAGVAVLGMGIAMILHATHNILVTAPSVFATGADRENAIITACVGALISDYAGLLLIVILAIISSTRETRIMREELVEEVQVGRLTPHEYELITNGGRRWRERWRALRTGGWGQWRWLGRFFDLSTELALRKHRRFEGRPHHQEANAREVEKLRWMLDYHRGLMVSTG